MFALALLGGTSVQTGCHPKGEPQAGAPQVSIGEACDKDPRCDRITGCIAPQWPYDIDYEQLPEGPQTDQWQAALEDFAECRREALVGQDLHAQALRVGLESQYAQALSADEFTYFSKKVRDWSGNIFWEPASKERTGNQVTQAGDEARAVFGPLPDADCSPGGKSKLLMLEVDGNKVDLVPNADAGGALQFQHTDVDGKLVKWTTELKKCDKPSIAGGVTYCGMNSRLGFEQRGNVRYILLCRKTKKATTELAPDEYWKSTSPAFNLLGYIIFNSTSGEVAFFAEADKYGRGTDTYSWASPIRPPGGSGYKDPDRDDAATKYDRLFKVPCLACHDNMDPQTITPYIKQKRVGYRDPKLKVFAADNLPQNIRGKSQPYRIVGSGFTAVNVPFLKPPGDPATESSRKQKQGMAIEDPTGPANCTGCHALTSLNTGKTFAADAVGRGIDPGVDLHRTNWAKDEKKGIHPWMTYAVDPPSKGGPDFTGEKPTAEEWKALSACITDPSRPECEARPIYSTCPAPESKITKGKRTVSGKEVRDTTRLEDPSGPQGVAESYVDNTDSDSDTYKKRISVTWKYHNNLGGVPQRDDVRFDLALKELDIPSDGRPPDPADYPQQPSLSDKAYQSGDVVVVKDVVVIKNASFRNHEKWIDPSPTTVARNYRVDHPARCDKRYVYRLIAKRFCFDQSNALYSEEANGPNTSYVDVKCGGGKQIAFSSSRALDGTDASNGTSNIWLINADGTGLIPVTKFSCCGESRLPQWSPNATRIVFESPRKPDGSDANGLVFNIWRVNADGTGLSSLTKVTAFGANSVTPQWSPDGSRIVFASSRAIDGTDASNSASNIWLTNGDGTGLMPLTKATDLASSSVSPQWSPDGTRIVFTSGRAVDGINNTFSNIWLINAGGMGLIPLTKTKSPLAATYTDSPQWSPDGTRVVFHSLLKPDGSDKTGLASNIWRINTDGTGVIPLTKATAYGADSLNPQWSPDGTRIVFTSSRALDGTDARNTFHTSNIWLINADGTGLIPLTKATANGADSRSPQWLSDGGRIVFESTRALDSTDASNTFRTSNIWLINADGTGLIPLTGATAMGASSFSPRPSP